MHPHVAPVHQSHFLPPLKIHRSDPWGTLEMGRARKLASKCSTSLLGPAIPSPPSSPARPFSFSLTLAAWISGAGAGRARGAPERAPGSASSLGESSPAAARNSRWRDSSSRVPMAAPGAPPASAAAQTPSPAPAPATVRRGWGGTVCQMDRVIVCVLYPPGWLLLVPVVNEPVSIAGHTRHGSRATRTCSRTRRAWEQSDVVGCLTLLGTHLCFQLCAP